MPPRSSFWGACRSLAIRTTPKTQPPQQQQQPRLAALARRLSSDARPPDSGASRPPMPPIPPSMMRPGEHRPQHRPPSGPAARADGEEEEHDDAELMGEPTEQEKALHNLELVSHGLNPFEESYSGITGYKFGLPPMPTGKLHEAQYHMRHRYEEGILQLTKLLMRDGKLGKAQRDMALILNFLRTSPAPLINPQRPLLPGAPPPEHLPLNPNTYLMLAVDTVAPLIRMRGFSGLAGGGKALQVPVPISRRTRRRMAWSWIMDSVNKKQSMGSGKRQLAHRIAEEVVAVVEGRSSVWDKRNELHKLGTSTRANLNSRQLSKMIIM